jgi:hypothetical protein
MCQLKLVALFLRLFKLSPLGSHRGCIPLVRLPFKLKLGFQFQGALRKISVCVPLRIAD